MSTAYYAMFHCLAACCADSLVGGTGARRSKSAWRQVYRALQHGFACDQCRNRSVIQKFPLPVLQFAAQFVTMQVKRNEADYDPYAKLYKSAVKTDIAASNAAIKAFAGAKAKDKRAFAALVLLKGR